MLDEQMGLSLRAQAQDMLDAAGVPYEAVIVTSDGKVERIDVVGPGWKARDPSAWQAFIAAQSPADLSLSMASLVRRCAEAQTKRERQQETPE